jgi:hypothetical protein
MSTFGMALIAGGRGVSARNLAAVVVIQPGTIRNRLLLLIR